MSTFNSGLQNPYPLYLECCLHFSLNMLTVALEHILVSSHVGLTIISWIQTPLIVLLQADVLEYYDQTVNSPSGSFYIPAVLRVQISEMHQ